MRAKRASLYRLPASACVRLPRATAEVQWVSHSTMRNNSRFRPTLRSAPLLLCGILNFTDPQHAIGQHNNLQQGCVAPTQWTSSLLGRFSHMMMQRDLLNTGLRERLNLPRVPPDSLQIVTDSTICGAAAAAYARKMKMPVAHVHILRADDRFLVIDPLKHVGEWKIVLIFDPTFVKSVGSLGY